MSGTPLKIRAVFAMQNLLKLINGTGDYHCDVAGRIFVGRGMLDENERPGGSVNSGDGEPEGGRAGRHSGRSYTMGVVFNIDLFAPSDGVNGAGVNALWLEADAKRALQSTDGKLSDADGDIGSIEFLGEASMGVEGGAGIEGSRLTFAVQYDERWGDPTRVG